MYKRQYQAQMFLNNWKQKERIRKTKGDIWLHSRCFNDQRTHLLFDQSLSVHVSLCIYPPVCLYISRTTLETSNRHPCRLKKTHTCTHTSVLWLMQVNGMGVWQIGRWVVIQKPFLDLLQSSQYAEIRGANFSMSCRVPLFGRRLITSLWQDKVQDPETKLSLNTSSTNETTLYKSLKNSRLWLSMPEAFWSCTLWRAVYSSFANRGAVTGS